MSVCAFLFVLLLLWGLYLIRGQATALIIWGTFIVGFGFFLCVSPFDWVDASKDFGCWSLKLPGHTVAVSL